MTDEARAALGNNEYVRLTVFPFRIGRESRSANRLARVVSQLERRLNAAPQLNELYLIEPSSQSLHISREHCAIDWIDGGFVLLDRGSACGSTIIEARPKERCATIATTQVGGQGSTLRSVVLDGDVIVLGTIDSPFVFRFQVESTGPSAVRVLSMTVVTEP
jgi:hypothetical protein